MPSNTGCPSTHRTATSLLPLILPFLQARSTVTPPLPDLQTCILILKSCKPYDGNLCISGVKFTQQMSCDTVSSARSNGGERAGRLMVSPIQLEPSHTLLESHNPKLVRFCLVVPHHFRSKCPAVMTTILSCGCRCPEAAHCLQ